MPAFHVTSQRVPRPPSARTIFCDGSADDSYRDGTDLELSHWIPNRTPAAYKADTSTAICMKFAADQVPDEWGLVVNNHVDTDGMLSVFTLVHAEFALAHRQPIVEAAAMGDFMGWGGDVAQRLFQRLARLKIRRVPRRVDPNETYRRCFDATIELLSAPTAVAPEEDVGLAALRESVRDIESGRIRREQVGERLTSYTIPRSLSQHALKRALRIPAFDAPLTDASLLLPQARARFDRERLQLVSVEGDSGWYHDLWYPGYVWAETPESWRPDGLVLESSNSHRVESPPLAEAALRLQQSEQCRGRWEVATRLTPFETLPGRGSPVVLSFIHHSRPAPSSQPPDAVAAVLLDAGLQGGGG